ncbi:MAG TPA: glycosyltransferase [Mycobacteriales bacterium]|nr:glycosyltransferase [Mycobacteriales bacterium]
MRVTVCVVVKDRRELMRRCLEAVLAEGPDEVVVVDNGSTDGTWEDLQAVPDPRLRAVQDLGTVGRIRNLAAELARGDVVAYTDSDCRPRPGWLRAGLAAMTDGIGVVQGRTVPEHASDVPWSVTQDIGAPSGLFEACNIFYRRTALLEAGGFDEAVGFFGEDTAAGWAVQRAGWKDAWAQDAVVEHVVTTPGFGWHLRRAKGYANWPALVAAYPEKRSLLWHRLFLRRRSAETDAAVVAALASLVLTSPWPLLGAVPFCWRHVGRHWASPRTALRDGSRAAVFDLAVSAALVRGSVKHRTAVL